MHVSCGSNLVSKLVFCVWYVEVNQNEKGFLFWQFLLSFYVLT